MSMRLFIVQWKVVKLQIATLATQMGTLQAVLIGLAYSSWVPQT